MAEEATPTDNATAAPEEAAPAPEPTPETPAPESTEPAAQAAPEPGSPWAKDLESRFENPEQRQAVDEFLKETVQPYVTKIEQDSTENRYANRLWDDFSNAPEDTYRSVTEEIYGAEMAEKIMSAIEDADPNFDPEEQTSETTEDGEIPARLQPIIDDFENRQREDVYKREIERLQEDNKDVKIDPETFHPFVAAAQGDTEVALAGYKQWLSNAKETFGMDVDTDKIKPEAPPVIDSPANTSPPEQESYPDIDSALDSFFAEQKTAPTPVGAT